MFSTRFSVIVFLCCSISGIAQESDSLSLPLETVIIRSFEQGRTIRQIPSAINYVSPAVFDRFGPASIVMAINSTPGIRMEERSPGSYRLNIRGSGLRSPFGVRNVKIYFNDIPLTDPGGNSFFNQLAPANFSSMEIIKGPGTSMYGAGTGGAIIINSYNNPSQPSALQYDAGSFNLQQVTAKFLLGNTAGSHLVNFQLQHSDGYRRHSEMNRKTLLWTGKFSMRNNNLSTLILLGDHFYQTPGALTRIEFEKDPKQARPGSPGAIENNSFIRQKTMVAGATWMQQITNKIHNKITVYGMATELTNPAIRNYGTSVEPHTGIRTVFNINDSIKKGLISFVLGGEWQKGFPEFRTYKNNLGIKDSLQWKDEVMNRQHFFFSQFTVEKNGWKILAGASLNNYVSKIERFSPGSSGIRELSFSNKFSPRISIARMFRYGIVYSGISSGFSPAGISEINPTGSAVNTFLKPEDGINYDLGIRMMVDGVLLDINAFLFELKNAIVLRRDSAGGDYYVNSGRTRQTGFETSMNYPFAIAKAVKANLWLSHTFHAFRYRDFKQLENDFSGNLIPGISPVTISSGMNLNFSNGVSAVLNYFFSDAVHLNDANTAFAPAYHLAGVKFGYEKMIRMNYKISVVLGLENILDADYSLGHDINGFGGRYYNAAPGRSFTASIRLEAGKK